MLDARSTAVLAQVCPDLAAKVQAASDTLNTENTFILVVSGLRTAAQQNALYAQGRATGGHIVTNARAGYSMHNYGLAVDVVPYLTGSSGQVNWTYSTPQFQRLVGAMKAQGLEWGGDWKGSLGDYDHFQLTDLPASPSAIMRTDYGTGLASLNPIWTKATDGSYAV
jgi:peptidoglycan L-alanyl-D-glutamate endopeptidase CwlK